MGGFGGWWGEAEIDKLILNGIARNPEHSHEKEEQSWRSHTFQPQNLQSYSNQDCGTGGRTDIEINGIRLRVQK